MLAIAAYCPKAPECFLHKHNAFLMYVFLWPNKNQNFKKNFQIVDNPH